MNLYMKTTTDKYELPLAVEDSPAKLARRLGLKRHSVATLCSKQICGYHRIRMEDDMNDCMTMTENEIVKEYKEAKKKNAQIQILAELNCVEPKKIRAILQKHGVYQKPGPKMDPDRKPAQINEEFESAVQEMIEESKKPAIEPADPVPGETALFEELPDTITNQPILEKPPVGLAPRYIAESQFRESRIRDIIYAMYRYYEADKTIPEEWRFELKERL